MIHSDELSAEIHRWTRIIQIGRLEGWSVCLAVFFADELYYQTNYCSLPKFVPDGWSVSSINRANIGIYWVQLSDCEKPQHLLSQCTRSNRQHSGATILVWLARFQMLFLNFLHYKLCENRKDWRPYGTTWHLMVLGSLKYEIAVV